LPRDDARVTTPNSPRRWRGTVTPGQLALLDATRYRAAPDPTVRRRPAPVTTTPRVPIPAIPRPRSLPPATLPPASSTVVLEVGRLPGGRLRLTSPHLPGWIQGFPTRECCNIGLAVAAALTEADVRTYSARRSGAAPRRTPATATPATATPASTPTTITAWRRSWNPEDWEPLTDGRWRSPTGRIYKADSTVVANVKKRRANAGLPNAPVNSAARGVTHG
jgi:hypothetical protein